VGTISPGRLAKIEFPNSESTSMLAGNSVMPIQIKSKAENFHENVSDFASVDANQGL
jgi:hypothetical protein